MTATLSGTLSSSRPDTLDAPSLVRFEDALLRIVRTVFRAQTDASSPIDKAGYVTLARLGRCGAVRLSDLAAEMELDLSTVSRQVKVLEGAGLVSRAADPDDRRAAVVDLTAAGQRELTHQRAQRFQTLVEALGLMPGRDRDRLLSLLDQLAAGLPGETGCSKTLGKASR